MVKAILLEVYYSLSPSIGSSLGRDGTINHLQFLNGGDWRWKCFASYIRNIIKNKSKQPKESN